MDKLKLMAYFEEGYSVIFTAVGMPAIVEEVESAFAELEKTKRHDIDIVIDRIILKRDSFSRVFEAVELASEWSQGFVLVVINEKIPSFRKGLSGFMKKVPFFETSK